MNQDTPGKLLQDLADDFLAGLENSRFIDPSCTLACLLQRVRDEALEDAAKECSFCNDAVETVRAMKRPPVGEGGE